MEFSNLNKPNKKLLNKCGKKILGYALDGFYAFEDDEIEDVLDKALLKFEGRIDWRKATRIYLFSFERIRNKICQVGYSIYG